MLLGFKRRFEPFVLDGSKAHTIRGKRKRRPKVGETCHCYVDPRQRTMRLLGRWTCVKVEDIRIYDTVSLGEDPQRWKKLRTYRFVEDTVVIEIDGQLLSRDEKNAFAWRDGFRSSVDGAFVEMIAFWARTHGKGERLDFHGDVIHWRYEVAKKRRMAA